MSTPHPRPHYVVIINPPNEADAQKLTQEFVVNTYLGPYQTTFVQNLPGVFYSDAPGPSSSLRSAIQHHLGHSNFTFGDIS